jgi:uncharacterized membrane protein YeaQ/YmgE (transglycosylase-associated protein family)
MAGLIPGRGVLGHSGVAWESSAGSPSARSSDSPSARAPGRFPGGIAGTVAAGTAGGFLGGGIFTLAAQRGTSRIDLTALGIAVVGALLIPAAALSAGYVDPGPR